ncbi:TMhelix containing protein [Vibrio phage 1.029.O._10N.261.55.A7]|nr:TMhelix containing protein [Vibrio phage 1.029.O._10N.261.55.A7]
MNKTDRSKRNEAIFHEVLFIALIAFFVWAGWMGGLQVM